MASTPPILQNIPLSAHTTLAVGGPARAFVEAKTEDDVRFALRFAADRDLPVIVLGGGSNLLVADRGLDALVLRVRIQGVTLTTTSDTALLSAGAGEPWDSLVERAVAADLTGLECLSGIPGDAGSTPIQNVGAYGAEVADTLERVTALDRATLETTDLPASECGFAYRDSAFKGIWSGRFVITRVHFRLKRGAPPALRYGELTRALAENKAPSVADVRTAILRLRRSKSMVYDPADPNHKSAGSFFTNPIVSASTLERARKAAESVLRPGESMPEFPAGPGLTKLAAGWLIERAGFVKGTVRGPVGLSTNHALALINRGDATAADLLSFALEVKRGVHARFGVSLVPEPVLAGFDPDETRDLLATESD